MAAATYESDCEACPQGWKRGEIDSPDSCQQCILGQTTASSSAPSCSLCDVGKYGTSRGVCADCKNGTYTDNKGETFCQNCINGEVNEMKSSCQKCGLGKHGFGVGRCVSCENGQVQDRKGKSECTKCPNSKIPNAAKTGCENPNWPVREACNVMTEYFNDTDPNRNNHTCADCPLGGYCREDSRNTVRNARVILHAYDLKGQNGLFSYDPDNYSSLDNLVKSNLDTVYSPTGQNSDLFKAEWTDNNGRAEFTLPLEMILKVSVLKIDGNDEYLGANFINIQKEKTTTQVVKLLDY